MAENTVKHAQGGGGLRLLGPLVAGLGAGAVVGWAIGRFGAPSPEWRRVRVHWDQPGARSVEPVEASVTRAMLSVGAIELRIQHAGAKGSMIEYGTLASGESLTNALAAVPGITLGGETRLESSGARTELGLAAGGALGGAVLAASLHAWRPRRVLRSKQEIRNSLGMRFVPVLGTDVRFSIWLTRVWDYAAFVRETRREWPKPAFAQTGTHPAINVSWADAKAFCEWLTERDINLQLIGPQARYRLPTDEEWSVAVGLPEETGPTPREKSGGVKGHYPWGAEWPPPETAGNYRLLRDRRGIANTSSVGTFPANSEGLYDLGGNAWEWCEDWYDESEQERVLRGASWRYVHPVGLGSAYRAYALPTSRNDINGFRCVLEGE